MCQALDCGKIRPGTQEGHGMADTAQPQSANQALVQSQFGANAANYTTSGVHAKGASLARLVELVGPKPDWTCLDIATATGHTAFAFAPHVAHVTASDITPEMLDEARKLAADRGIENVSFASADATGLPFEDTSFDLVTCRIAPHHFPDIPAFLAGVVRVLKPGGVFALVDNIAPDQHTDSDSDADALIDAATAYNAFEKVRDPSHGRALPHQEWLDLTEAAGLQVRTTEHLEKSMSFRKWCHTMSVPEEKVPGLRAVLDTADGALARYLRPTPKDDGDIGFTLTELVLIAEKSS
jgi:ubiquinone/menaquinone biosynthesis C-methylase UbiE